jgi:hypothetical protein
MSIMDNIDELEQNAKYAATFGFRERATEMYAKAFRLALRAGLYDKRCADIMIQATWSLADGGKYNDAFDGARRLILIFMCKRDFKLASHVLDCLKMVATVHPTMSEDVGGLRRYVARTINYQNAVEH